MLKGFKKFISQGNVIDLAVAVIEPFSPGKPPDWRGSARWCGRDWAGGVGVVRAGAARDSVF